jgi:hypothetical protein
MKKQTNTTANETVALRLWTLAGATKIIPYIHSLSKSLRDAWLEMRQAQSRVRHLEARPGRPDRETLVQLKESQHDIERAESRLEETIEEMLPLSAYCIDPAAGLVVVPTLCKETLAWFIFDLFDTQGLASWRLHSDPIEMRRPLSEYEPASPAPDATAVGPADAARLN